MGGEQAAEKNLQQQIGPDSRHQGLRFALGLIGRLPVAPVPEDARRSRQISAQQPQIHRLYRTAQGHGIPDEPAEKAMAAGHCAVPGAGSRALGAEGRRHDGFRRNWLGPAGPYMLTTAIATPGINEAV